MAKIKLITRNLDKVAILIFLMMLGCEDHQIKDPEKVVTTLMTNGFDPLFITFEKDNKIIEVYGIRNELGVPTQLTDVLVKDKITSLVTQYKFDNQNLLKKIIASNKVQFLFEWISTQKAAVTVIANDGSSQLNTVIDFSGTPTGAPSIQNGPTVNRKDLPLKLEFSDKLAQSPINQPSTLANGGSSVTINVDRCGAPAEAEVGLSVSLVDGTQVASFPANRIGPGTFTTSIPTNLAPSINPSDICSSLASLLGYACTIKAIPALCPGITAALLLSVITAPLAVEIGVACTEAVAGLEFYCATLNYSGGSNQSVAKLVCEAPILDRTFTQDLILTPYVIGIPSNILGDYQRVHANGPFPTLSVSLGATTKIENFQLVPPVPVAGQSYLAILGVDCIKQGSLVKLTIVGTDGYTKSMTYSVSNTQSQGTFTLTVPGAQTGVRDVVTVVISLPDGTILTRTASLVFA